jgi:exosortase
MCSKYENINVVILAGSKDFGRCRIASRTPVSKWPFIGRPVIERVIRSLGIQGVREITVCSEQDVGDFAAFYDEIRDIKLNFVEEPLRAGTAGCVRDAVSGRQKETTVVIPAAMVRPPDINGLICAHFEQKADLTAALNPCDEQEAVGTSTGIYVCNKKVLEHIPEGGYCDIKEWLIPELVRLGYVVKAYKLPWDVHNFRDAQGYLNATAAYLENEPSLNEEIPSLRRKTEQLWLDDGAEVDPSAKFIGPVVVMAGAKVSKGAVVFGPTVIGRNCRLGRNSVVIRSVVWDGADIGTDCEIQHCLLDYNVKVKDNAVFRYSQIPSVKAPTLIRDGEQSRKLSGIGVYNLRYCLQHSVGWLRSHSILPEPAKAGWWLAAAAITIAFMWSYWPIIVDLCNAWKRSDEYSSGMLVPFLAVYILWSRRDQLNAVPIKPTMWGLLALLFAEGLRLFGAFFMYGFVERFSVVVAVAALVLFLLGWQFFKKTIPILLFLCLMLPWPNRVQAAVALPLQRWATSSAAFCLELIGYNVALEGDIIRIGRTTVAVAEACNGLRMVTAFLVISGMVVLLVKRQKWEKVVLLASSLPIALLCNSLRLTVTAIAFTLIKGDYWEKLFHDFGGYAMMPVAIAALVAELWFLQRLTPYRAA